MAIVKTKPKPLVASDYARPPDKCACGQRAGWGLGPPAVEKMIWLCRTCFTLHPDNQDWRDELARRAREAAEDE